MGYLQVFLTAWLNLHRTDAKKETFPHIIGFCNLYAFFLGFHFYDFPLHKISHKKYCCHFKCWEIGKQTLTNTNIPTIISIASFDVVKAVGNLLRHCFSSVNLKLVFSDFSSIKVELIFFNPPLLL